MPVEIKPKQTQIGDWDDDVEIERNRFNKSNTYSKPTFIEKTAPPIPKRLVKLESSNENKIPSGNGSFPVGVFVKHSIFGIGKVMETSVVNGNEKADIDFGEKGTKSLLLKFAKLEVLK